MTDDVTYLRSARAVRERAEQMYALAERGELTSWTIDDAALAPVAERVVRTTRAAYPDVRAIPFHSRFRHFDVGGVDRLAALAERLRDHAPRERTRALFDLIITSVLLDAGAGERWSFREPGGGTYARSEGLAVASYHLFASGALSRDPTDDPLRVDAPVLSSLDEATGAGAFQVGPDNPLVGLSGRVALLRRLGDVVGREERIFGAAAPRPGHLADHLLAQRGEGRIAASSVLSAVLDGLSEIWPGREVLGGVNLGDVWTHPRLGRVPFHKLSQWLTYSLCEALERSGVTIVEVAALTGLAEYRNGGLFIDGGVLRPRHEAVLGAAHAVGSPVVVEWRALTVALLDRTAVLVRERLGFSEEEMPLARVLEGGTWRAGRELAREKRPGGESPMRIESDGTVF